MGNCPACEIIGNAVVGSTQRGIVIHSTHQSTVSRNVVFGVKGAFIYVEEGVEIDNTIQVGGCCVSDLARLVSKDISRSFRGGVNSTILVEFRPGCLLLARALYMCAWLQCPEHHKHHEV
jgi:parallel beta-helix repeat protein